MKIKFSIKELQLFRLKVEKFTFRMVLLLFTIVAAAVTAFNFWFINHSETVLEQIVYDQSGGKLKLKVNAFRFNWINNKMELEDALIFSADTNTITSYAINTKRIYIKARGFLPLLFRREMLIDSMMVTSPRLEITRRVLREKNKKGAGDGKGNFSVAEELGRISKSVLTVINVLKVDVFKLSDGSFTLIDRTEKGNAPFTVSNVYLQLDHLQLDSAHAGALWKKKITFANNIAIRSFNQNLKFPGGRHSLSFKDFRVNLADKRVEFDSCTIRAIRGDSSKTSFRFFIDKLQLTNINFDSLYSTEAVIADSAFCSKPKIFLDIDGDRAVAKNRFADENKVGEERVDAVIQQLLGDIKLKYIGVKDADIDVNTIKKNKASTFSSRHSNIDIYGLEIRQDEQRPIRLDKFLMSLHSYENILQDGRYHISLDSIGFENEAINLNRFSFKEYEKGKVVKNLAMPRFQVRGLSWEALLYNNVFSAHGADFYNPVVDYAINKSRRKSGTKDIFQVLNSIDEIMNLQNLRVFNGDILLRLKNGTFSFQRMNLDLKANDLAKATRINSIQRSINTLGFEEGIFSNDDLEIHLHKVNLSENKNGLNAAEMLVKNSEIDAKATGVKLGNLALDSIDKSIIIDDLYWEQASIRIDKSREREEHIGRSKKKDLQLQFRNVAGSNTLLSLNDNQNRVTGNLPLLKLTSFVSNNKGWPTMEGLELKGENIVFAAPDSRLAIDAIELTDQARSTLHGIQYVMKKHAHFVNVTVPKLYVTPDISPIFNGDIQIQELEIYDPVVNANLKISKNKKLPQPSMPDHLNVKSVLIFQPRLSLTLNDESDSASHIYWDGSRQNGYLKIRDVKLTPEAVLKIDQVSTLLNNFEFVTAKGKRIALLNNQLNLELNNVQVQTVAEGAAVWNADANISAIDRLVFDSLGKKNSVLELDKGQIRNVHLSAENIRNPFTAILRSKNLMVSGLSGKFNSEKNLLSWSGLSFKNRTASLDALDFAPKQPIAEYRIKKAFDEDYLKVHTGKIVFHNIDVNRMVADSIFKVDNISVADANLLTFKDKTQPNTTEKYKPLPAEMLKKLKTPIQIDSVSLTNMRVDYWEINPQTDSLGIVPVERLNVLARNIKNRNLNASDSLYIYATADVLGSLHTTLDVAQSYTDTSGFMRMNLETGAMQLSRFNSVLIPLLGAKVFAGDLARLRIEATGNNDAASGTVSMYYRGLKAGILNKKDLATQNLLNRMVSGVAMGLVVRKNGRGKSETLFFERWKQKSPINYIIKTSLEGIKSGIGLPGAKRKQYLFDKNVNQQRTISKD